MWLREAIEAAQDAGLDLIEVAPDAKPPVCRIMDWGRYRYEQQRREREQRRKQRVTEVKSLRLRPTTDDHDFAVTQRRAERFLSEGHKVRVEVRFRGREITHRELGQEMLYRLARAVSEYGDVEQMATMEGRKMFIMIAPKPPGSRPAPSESPAADTVTADEALHDTALEDDGIDDDEELEDDDLEE